LNTKPPHQNSKKPYKLENNSKKMLELFKIIETKLAAVVILLVGLIIGLVVKKILKKVLHEVELDKTILRLGKNYSLENKLSGLAAYIIYFLALVIFLNQLGITFFILYLVAGVILLLLGATFLLGVKDFIPNLIAGITIYRKEKLAVGKKIKINNIAGKIVKLGLLEIEIETSKKDRIYIPNALLLKSKFLLKD
tara:strand:- start:777 stop:1361 length:585 start_codon:yes stop_codon:yes gene_type:complete